MTFSETLRKIGTMVGLYGKDDPPYDGYGPDEGGYDDPYGGGRDGGYGYNDSAYAYENAPRERAEDPAYTGVGGGGYSRAGVKPQQPARESRFSQPQRQQQQAQRPGNVIRMPEREAERPQRYPEEETRAPQRSAAPQQAYDGAASAKTMVFCVRRLEDSGHIIDHLCDGVTIILNLEELDDLLYRRVLDMISGAAYALNANIVRTSLRVYLIAPRNVVIIDDPQPRDEYREGREGRDTRGGMSRW